MPSHRPICHTSRPPRSGTRMTPDYERMNRELPKLKARLTRAQKAKDPEAVLRACVAAFQEFNRSGFPDAWHRWNVAASDQGFKLGWQHPLFAELRTLGA